MLARTDEEVGGESENGPRCSEKKPQGKLRVVRQILPEHLPLRPKPSQCTLLNLEGDDLSTVNHW